MREIDIPLEHQEVVATLSRANNHAAIRAQIADMRFNRAMQGDDADVACNLHDALQAAKVGAQQANDELWDFLKETFYKVKESPAEWVLSWSNKKLIHEPKHPLKLTNGSRP